MRFDEIHIGDTLKIREWDDMVNEFGVDKYGNIPCDFVFTRTMKRLCGHTFTVRQIHIKKTKCLIKAEEHEFYVWSIGTDMLEPFIKADNFDDINDSELFDILQGG